MAQATIDSGRRWPRGRARRTPGAALGRWGLRGAALLYLGLFILLPVAAILQAGFSDGLTNLSAALDSFGAKGAIELTLIMATITAIVNGVFGTLLAYVLVRIPFPGRSVVSTIVDEHEPPSVVSVVNLERADTWARRRAAEVIVEA